MKKFAFIFIFIILFSLTIVSLVFAIRYKKEIKELNAEINLLNVSISNLKNENESLSDNQDFLKEQYENLKSTKPEEELIDVEIQECMKSCNYTTVCMNECVYASENKYEKEMNKYINLLKKIMTKEQIAKLQNSQKKWIEYKNSQQILNSGTIGKMEGTMYTNVLSGEQVGITELRAKELKSLYHIISQK